MDEWREGIWLAVSAFLTALLITFAVVLGSMSRSVAVMQQKDIDTVAELEEYRKSAKYDNVIVNQADVVNCIYENRSKVPGVVVTRDPAVDNESASFSFFNPNASFIVNRQLNIANPPPPPYYLWDGANQDEDDYLADNLNAYMPPGATYRAKLEKDGNGVLLYIWFRRIT